MVSIKPTEEDLERARLVVSKTIDLAAGQEANLIADLAQALAEERMRALKSNVVVNLFKRVEDLMPGNCSHAISECSLELCINAYRAAIGE